MSPKRQTVCECKPLLDGTKYTDDCPTHTTLPAPVECAAHCGQQIGPRDPRLVLAVGVVHWGCADRRTQLGLDGVTTPGERQERGRKQRTQRDDGPLHMQPGKWPKLRGRRRR